MVALRLLLLTLVSVSAASACRRAGAADASSDSASASAIRADSVRGVLSLVGSEPLPVLLLSPTASSGMDTVVLVGALSSTLRNVVGLDIVVAGRRTGERVPGVIARGAMSLDVRQFIVRAADGVATHDGVLARRDSLYLLRDADGIEHALPSLPASLRRMLGARVWLAGPLAASPTSYGVIVQPQ